MNRIVLIVILQFPFSFLYAQEINCQKGIEYEKKNELGKAIKEFSHCIKNDNNDFQLYNHRGKCYSQIGNQNLAYLDFMKADSLKPESEAINNNIGITLELQEKYTDALVYYDIALRINNEYTEAYFNKGRTYEKLKKYDSAELYYRKVAEINPIDKGVYVVLAMLYEETGRFDSAIIMQTNAIRIDSNDQDLYYYRAIDYDTLKEYNLAIQDYNIFLNKSKNNYDYLALCKRGKSKELIDDLEGALEDYSKAIDGNNKKITAYIYRCKLYLKLQELEKACSDYKAILKKDILLSKEIEIHECN